MDSFKAPARSRADRALAFLRITDEHDAHLSLTSLGLVGTWALFATEPGPWTLAAGVAWLVAFGLKRTQVHKAGDLLAKVTEHEKLLADVPEERKQLAEVRRFVSEIKNRGAVR